VHELPPAAYNKARAVGADGWLERLPEILHELEQSWEIQIGAPYADATEAFVARATTSDGDAAVVKVLIPREGTAAAHEIEVLQRTDGDGCVRLLRDDVTHGALLLERLGRSLSELGWPIERRLDVLCSAASRVWRPVHDSGLPSGADKARWLTEFITTKWTQLDRPCSELAVDHALACAGQRSAAHRDERAVLVHGDVHQWNALEAGDGFKLVDPDGLVAEPEHDLGVLMREDPLDLLQGRPWDRAHQLAARTALDATAIWEWGVVERVSTGLSCTEVDLQPVGRQMLEAADVIAAEV
jgi:streptomycin 6-kinase